MQVKYEEKKNHTYVDSIIKFFKNIQLSRYFNTIYSNFNGYINKSLILLILQHAYMQVSLWEAVHPLYIKRQHIFVKYSFVGPVWHPEVCVIPTKSIKECSFPGS